MRGLQPDREAERITLLFAGRPTKSESDIISIVDEAEGFLGSRPPVGEITKYCSWACARPGAICEMVQRQTARVGWGS
jgi:hypothetical protein